jgi:hypothetical protein
MKCISMKQLSHVTIWKSWTDKHNAPSQTEEEKNDNKKLIQSEKITKGKPKSMTYPLP